MKKIAFLLALIASSLILAGCCTPKTDTVTQVSTIDAVLEGVYDGKMDCADLLRHGDFGIGTFHSLDGEMTVLDGRIYQVCSDGKVLSPPRQTSTPFASVLYFKADNIAHIENGTTFKDFQQFSDHLASSPNALCAIKVSGTFSLVKTRSVPAQKKPYPRLIEVTKNQSEFSATNVPGTLVGFRLPPLMKGVNVPGYHLHFLSADKSFGGHVLDFTLAGGTLEIDECHRFFMVLPEGDSDFGRVDFTRDRTKDLEKAEQ